MNRERLTLSGVLAISAAMAALGFIGVLVQRNGFGGLFFNWRTPQNVQTQRVDGFLVQDTLPSASTTEEKLSQMLLAAFVSDTLFKAGTWDVPNREGVKLVVASPTTKGRAEQLECGFMRHPYCGLYLVTPTSTSLISWGSELTGFGGVVDFTDTNQPVLGFAWKFMNYMNVEQRVIDLGTGEGRTRVMIELDQDEQSSLLSVTGTGSGIELALESVRINGRTLPRSLIVTTAKGTYELYRMKAEELAALAKRSAESTVDLKAIALNDFAVEVQKTKELQLSLFNLPYLLNVDTGGLTKAASDTTL